MAKMHPNPGGEPIKVEHPRVVHVAASGKPTTPGPGVVSVNVRTLSLDEAIAAAGGRPARTPAPAARAMRLDQLHVDPAAYQVRAGEEDEDALADYTAAAKAGTPLPPLLAFKVTDRDHGKPALVGGFHTHQALLRAGVAEHPVEVREGTYREAVLAGWKSNLTHGLRYTNGDKRKMAAFVLRQHPGRSNGELAAMAGGISDELVRKVRTELEAAGQLAPAEKVVGRDGQRQAARKPSRRRQTPVPTVGTGVKPKLDETPDPVTPAAATSEDSCRTGDANPQVLPFRSPADPGSTPASSEQPPATVSGSPPDPGRPLALRAAAEGVRRWVENAAAGLKRFERVPYAKNEAAAAEVAGTVERLRAECDRFLGLVRKAADDLSTPAP